MGSALVRARRAGLSLWLDDLSRESIAGGRLAALVRESSVSGVTTNPSIFAQSLSADPERILALKAQGFSAARVIETLMCEDVRAACDLMFPLYEESAGREGRVSLEVEPSLAHDAAGTLERAVQLRELVARPGVMIKIPATDAGLHAITAATARGISVNATLIFSISRMREVAQAYLTGLEQARAAGFDISGIHSVASFFVSRFDTVVDAFLRDEGSVRTLSLVGRCALAGATLAQQAHAEVFSSVRAEFLLGLGANAQRPLWASTGTKDPTFSDTLYVDSLVVPGAVNTLPYDTLLAFADHGMRAGSVLGVEHVERAGLVLDELDSFGFDYVAACELLEREGVAKFADAWRELSATVAGLF